MDLIPVGYFAKEPLNPAAAEFLGPVADVASVAECVVSGADDWHKHWIHNDFWRFDSESLALSVVPAEKRESFSLYAYEVYPMIFELGDARPLNMPRLNVEPLSGEYEALGYEALLQALVNKPEAAAFLPWILTGIVFSIGGVAVGSVIFWVRYMQGLYEKKHNKFFRSNPWWAWRWYLAAASLACFVIGMGVVAWGGFTRLNIGPSPTLQVSSSSALSPNAFLPMPSNSRSNGRAVSAVLSQPSVLARRSPKRWAYYQ